MRGLSELIAVLVRHEVDFIVVGGVAGVLQGAPVSTMDLDIIYARDSPNVQRLLAALHEVDAHFRSDPRRLKPEQSHIESKGHKLLSTLHGDFDVLGSIEESTEYPDLVDDADKFEVAGCSIRVLSLERLIEVKEKLGRPKDQLMLMVLRATLQERQGLG